MSFRSLQKNSRKSNGMPSILYLLVGYFIECAAIKLCQWLLTNYTNLPDKMFTVNAITAKLNGPDTIDWQTFFPSFTNNSSSQNFPHPDNPSCLTFDTPGLSGFKPFPMKSFFLFWFVNWASRNKQCSKILSCQCQGSVGDRQRTLNHKPANPLIVSKLFTEESHSNTQ